MSDPEVEEFTMFKVGGSLHEPIVTLVVIGQQVPMEVVDTGACSSVCNFDHDSSKSLSHMSTKQYFNYPHNVHRKSNACGGRDESKGEL